MLSMTGFAERRISVSNGELSLRITSENSRFINVLVHIPPEMESIEGDLKKLIKSKSGRGSVRLSIASQKKVGNSPFISEKEILCAIKDYKKIIELEGLQPNISLGDISAISQLQENFSTPLNKGDLALIQKETLLLIANWNTMRQREGQQLGKIISRNLGQIEKIMRKVKGLTKKSLEKNFELLSEKLKKLTTKANISVNESDILKEAAFYACKVDIVEEIDRIFSHCKQFRETLKENPSGKKFDFILQEINREFNTIASKANMTELSKLVIDAKVHIETIREQVQNIV